MLPIHQRALTLLSGTVETRKMLCAQLEDIIGDFVVIDSFSLEEHMPDPPLKNRLVLLSSHLIAEEAKPFIGTGCEVITASRTVNFENIDKLLYLPAGTKALYVNDFPETVAESIENLLALGIDHIEYIPYYPGKQNNQHIPLAITPGEVNLVPEFVNEVVNLGPRLIDMTTIMEIIKRFQLLEEKGGEISKKYTRKIIELSKTLASTTRETSKLNKHFKQVLDGVNDGILAVDYRGKVTVLNEILETALKVSSKASVGKYIQDVIPDMDLAQFILTDSSEDNRVFTIRGCDFVVHRIHLATEQSYVATFKDVHETLKLERTLRRELIKKGYVAKYTFPDIIGSSPAIHKTKTIAAKLARTDLTILLEGESGTGKELFASAIHNESLRASSTFLAINFSALSEDLIESELFGYEEGAFTGAKKGGKMGLFEQANGGTIFLDEIGDISLKIQARLLRVLQEKEIMRIGGSKIIPINVRVIAATNKDLLRMIETGKFREDLYHRLKVLYVHLPELRNRKSDISSLIAHFVAQSGRSSVQFTPEVMERLRSYEWFGNVRELKNTLDYMLAVSSSNEITLEDIPDESFFQRAATGHRGELAYRRAGRHNGFDSDNEIAAEGKSSPYPASWALPPAWTQAHWSCSPPPAQWAPPFQQQESHGALEQEELRFILAELYEANLKGEPIGRKKIASLSSMNGRKPLTEQQVRHRMDLLKQLRYIVVPRGRAGVKVTQAGLDWLKTRSPG